MSINRLLAYHKRFLNTRFDVKIKNLSDPYLIRTHPDSIKDLKYINCVSLVNLSRAHYHGADNFLSTIAPHDSDFKTGSIRWWKDFLENDLEPFDATKRYPVGTLLWNPEHTALIYDNLEYSNNAFDSSIIHVIYISSEEKIIKIDNLLDIHTCPWYDSKGSRLKSGFAYVCLPHVWLNKEYKKYYVDI